MSLSVHDAVQHIRAAKFADATERYVDCFEVFFNVVGGGGLDAAPSVSPSSASSQPPRRAAPFAAGPVSEKAAGLRFPPAAAGDSAGQQRGIAGGSLLMKVEEDPYAVMTRENPLSLRQLATATAEDRERLGARHGHFGAAPGDAAARNELGGGRGGIGRLRSGSPPMQPADRPHPSMTGAVMHRPAIARQLEELGFASNSVGTLREAEQKRLPALLVVFQTQLCLVTPTAADEQLSWGLRFGVTDLGSEAQDRWRFERGRVANHFGWCAPTLAVTTVSCAGIQKASGARPTRITTKSGKTFAIFAATARNPSKAIFFFLHLAWGTLSSKYVSAFRFLIEARLAERRAFQEETDGYAEQGDGESAVTAAAAALRYGRPTTNCRRSGAAALCAPLGALPRDILDRDSVRALAHFPDEHAELHSVFGLPTVVSAAAAAALRMPTPHDASTGAAPFLATEQQLAQCEVVRAKLLGACAVIADLKRSGSQAGAAAATRLERVARLRFPVAVCIATNRCCAVAEVFPINPKLSSEIEFSKDPAHACVFSWSSVLAIQFAKGPLRSLAPQDQTCVNHAARCALGSDAIQDPNLDAAIRAAPVFKVHFVVSDPHSRLLSSVTVLASGAVPFVEGVLQLFETAWLRHIADSLGIDANAAELRATYRAYRALDPHAMGFINKAAFHAVFTNATGSAVLSRGIYSSFLGTPDRSGEQRLLTFANFLRAMRTLMCGGAVRRIEFLYNGIDGARRGGFAHSDLLLWVRQLTAKADIDSIWSAFPSSYHQWIRAQEFAERVLLPQSVPRQRFQGLGVLREDSCEHWGRAVFVGHRAWRAVYHAMVGISVVALHESVPVNVRHPKDVDHAGGGHGTAYGNRFITQRIFDSSRGVLIADVEEPRLVPDAITQPNVLIELCPDIFRELRALAGVSMASLNRAMGITAFTAALAGGSFVGLHEAPMWLSNPLGPFSGLDLDSGPTSSTTLESHDGSYHLVLLPPERLHDLLETLPMYYEYIKLTPQTSLLPRFLGLFAASYVNVGGVPGQGGESVKYGADAAHGGAQPSSPEGVWERVKKRVAGGGGDEGGGGTTAVETEMKRRRAHRQAWAARHDLHKTTCYFVVVLSPFANVRKGDAKQRLPAHGRTLIFGRRSDFVVVEQPGMPTLGRSVLEPVVPQLRLSMPNATRRFIKDVVKRDLDFLANQVYMHNYGIVVNVYLDNPPPRVTSGERSSSTSPGEGGRSPSRRHSRSRSPASNNRVASAAAANSPSGSHHHPSVPRSNSVEYEILADNSHESMCMYGFSAAAAVDESGMAISAIPPAAAQLLSLSSFHDAASRKHATGGGCAASVYGGRLRDGSASASGDDARPSAWRRTNNGADEYERQVLQVSLENAGAAAAERWIVRPRHSPPGAQRRPESGTRNDDDGKCGASARQLPPTWVCATCGTVNKRAEIAIPKVQTPGMTDEERLDILRKFGGYFETGGSDSAAKVTKRLKPCYLCFGTHERCLGGTTTRAAAVAGPNVGAPHDGSGPDTVLAHWEAAKAEAARSDGSLQAPPELFQRDVAVDTFMRLAGAIDLADPFHNDTLPWRCPGNAVFCALVRNGFEEQEARRRAAARERAQLGGVLTRGCYGDDPYGFTRESVLLDPAASDELGDLAAAARIVISFIDYGTQVRHSLPAAAWRRSAETREDVVHGTASEYASSMLLHLLDVIGDDFL